MSLGQIRVPPTNGSGGIDRAVHVGVVLGHGGSSMKPTERANGAPHTGVEQCFESASVCACVQERLSSCSHSYYFNRVSWYYIRGTLTLEGCVPTYYMKQILQTMLRDIEHVERIANQVDVVSSTGLSSERSAGPRW